MLAREVMSGPVVTVRTWTSISQTAQLLAGRGFTAVPVLDDDDRLVGIVSEADLIRRPWAPDPRRQPNWTTSAPVPRTVGEVMTTAVESLTPGADVADVARIMVDERIRCRRDRRLFRTRGGHRSSTISGRAAHAVTVDRSGSPTVSTRA